MKLFCENIEKIPNTATILILTKDERLVLEFPEEALDDSALNTVIDNLARKLPNHRVFNAGNVDKKIRITLFPVISKQHINENLELIITALKEYIQLGRTLAKNVTEDKSWNNWEITYAHSPHNQYENKITGEIIETCDYIFTDFKSIDVYFFGQFLEDSKKYTAIAKLIKSTYHDTARILDVVEKTGVIQEYLVQENQTK